MTKEALIQRLREEAAHDLHHETVALLEEAAQALAQPEQEPVETYIHEYTSQPHPNDFGIPKGHWWRAKQYADALAQPAYRAVKTVHEGKPVYVAQQDDDTQGFMPDWANFQEGRKVGRAEALEQIFDKVKKMPWENDTKDSFLIWLKEQE
jgi:hypothetical protein